MYLWITLSFQYSSKYSPKRQFTQYFFLEKPKRLETPKVLTSLPHIRPKPETRPPRPLGWTDHHWRGLCWRVNVGQSERDWKRKRRVRRLSDSRRHPFMNRVLCSFFFSTPRSTLRVYRKDHLRRLRRHSPLIITYVTGEWRGIVKESGKGYTLLFLSGMALRWEYNDTYGFVGYRPK